MPNWPRILITLSLACAALPAWATDCARNWGDRRPALVEMLHRPPPPGAFTRTADEEELADLPGVIENDQGVRLPLADGSTAILANEPAVHFQVLADLDDLGFWLATGWQPRHEGQVMRLVDKQSGAVTLIGGRPHPSPSHRRAVVVAGDSPTDWSGIEVWRLDRPVPHTEWDQDALGPADYAFAGWLDEDTVRLAARGLSADQPQPISAILACAGHAWHLLHDTAPSWLDRHRSPSGRRHALARKRGVAIWQDGEQVFAAAADVTAFERWDDEDDAVFAKAGGGEMRVSQGADGRWAIR